MASSSVTHSLFLVFTGAACLATVALYARQAMLVAYIVLGAAFGPWGLGMVSDAEWIREVAAIGIMFLLYLIGLNLPPQQLWRMMGEALWVAIASSLLFVLLGVLMGLVYGLNVKEALFLGAALAFSSTIIGVKLLPTTALHHRHTGQIIISLLLLQDLLAIVILLLLQGYGKGGGLLSDVALQLAGLPLMMGVAYALDRWVLERLVARFDQIHEYLFLLAIGWCLGMAELAVLFGLSHEIGAFIAGVTLASSPVALFIAESLKPVRDFFLVLFFFSLGAGFDLGRLAGLIVPAALMALAALSIKPLIFQRLLMRAGEAREISLEVGVRLGQNSEFALLIAVLALQTGFINEQVSYLVQMATLLTFIVSSYVVVLRYPTPIAVSDRLRRD
ncbi:MAG: cation:proton antiporter, partial [Gammaproteobacteria bacterium]